MVGTAEEQEEQPLPSIQPKEVGRYLIGMRIGFGGMGVVYRAYDPRLDRKVALKLLRSEVSQGQRGDRLRTRMESEARALARLAHPNVVTVYDVGVTHSSVFVAMEHVDGLTVKQWLVKEKQKWREILAVFLQAGRGLAAAHEAGVVHRDFKPSNVMIGRDGRVRVLDFGIAVTRQQRAEESAPDAASQDQDDKAPLADRQEAEGHAIGTPAYIAPELYSGIEAGPASDQFSFCAALYESLYGERPFAGQTPAEYQARAAAGEVRAAPAGSKVPLWLRRAVLKGLAPRPDGRYPSMAALLDDLANDPGVRRRRRLLATAVAALVVLAAVTSFRLLQLQTGLYESGTTRLAGVWDEQRRQEIRKVFSASGWRFALASLATVEEMLDTYAEQWLVLYAETCEASGRFRGGPDEVHELRMACLDDRLAELRAMTSALAEADDDLVRRSVEVTGGLRRISTCAEDIALMGRLQGAGSEANPDEVRELRDRLAEAHTLWLVGSNDQGIELAQWACERAAELGERVLEAESKLQLAYYYTLVPDSLADDEVRRLSYESVWIAEAEHADVIVARAWTLLLGAIGPADSEEYVLRTIRFARAAHERIGHHDELWAGFYASLASAEVARGLYDQAAEHLRQALSLREQAGSARGIGYVSNLNDLAATLLRQGQYAEAIPILDQALVLKQQLLGSSHDGVATTLMNLGIAHAATGSYDEAAARYDQALSIYTGAYHPYRSEVAGVHSHMGTLEWRRKNYQASLQHLLAAFEIQREELGERHVLTAVTLNNIGELYETIGDPDQAMEHYRLALEIEEDVFPPGHPYLAYPLTGIGRVHLTGGQPRAALPFLERALAIRSSRAGRPIDLADTCLALARALAETGDTRRARELAAQALASFEEAGQEGAERVAEAEALLLQLAARS
jgi:tetratricopeptide (TPR) repeat protein/predicted Ser/Thr protein kinase